MQTRRNLCPHKEFRSISGRFARNHLSRERAEPLQDTINRHGITRHSLVSDSVKSRYFRRRPFHFPMQRGLLLFSKIPLHYCHRPVSYRHALDRMVGRSLYPSHHCRLRPLDRVYVAFSYRRKNDCRRIQSQSGQHLSAVQPLSFPVRLFSFRFHSEHRRRYCRIFLCHDPNKYFPGPYARIQHVDRFTYHRLNSILIDNDRISDRTLCREKNRSKIFYFRRRRTDRYCYQNIN